MFAILHLRDSTLIPNHLLSTPPRETIIQILKDKHESRVSSELGFEIMVIDAEVDQNDKINSSDGTTYNVNFSVLTFYPKLQEIVEGELVEITDFGGFIRIGPIDALLQLSQIADDHARADVKGGLIVTEGGRKIKIGSSLRARITSVSYSHGPQMGKIGISCRQQFLGAEEWIQEDVMKARGQPHWRKDKKVSLCDHCSKKLGLGFRCGNCGGNFCDDHRLPENHDCKTRCRKLR